jgi:hypothetical protein
VNRDDEDFVSLEKEIVARKHTEHYSIEDVGHCRMQINEPPILHERNFHWEIAASEKNPFI